MRARFGSFEKPCGKTLRNRSISLRDRSDSEMEDKPPSTYAPLSITSISSCREWTPSFAYTCETCVFPFDNGAPTNMTLEAAKGINPDFGKDAHRLSAIRTAPFYGVRTSGYMLCTLDGITINENFQAVDDNGKAIEGLYVTGVDSGSYYARTYPNMSTGNCCGRSVTFGRMIGKALAAK